MSVLSDDKIAYAMGFANAHELREFIVWPTDFFDSVRAAIAADSAARAELWGFVVTAANGNQGALPEGSVLLQVARIANAPMFPLYTAPPAAAVVPEGWKHDCPILLTNDVELWISRCPHCGKPETNHE